MQTITKEAKKKVVKLHIQDGRTISSLAAEYGVCHVDIPICLWFPYGL